MTGKAKAFIDFYFGEANLNATAAARLAGYADPKSEACRLKKRPEVWAEIERILAERTFAASEVLEMLTQHANASLEPFLNIAESGDVSIDLTGEEAKARLHLIKKLKTRRRSGGRGPDAWSETAVEIELHDPQTALTLLARYHKLLTDKTEVTGANGAPIQVKHEYEQLRQLPPDVLLRQHRETLGD